MAVRYADDVKRPFRCMFIRDEKIKNGQRVAVRLFEEYLYESGGTRNYVITFSEKDINKAAPIR